MTDEIEYNPNIFQATENIASYGQIMIFKDDDGIDRILITNFIWHGDPGDRMVFDASRIDFLEWAKFVIEREIYCISHPLKFSSDCDLPCEQNEPAEHAERTERRQNDDRP